MNLTNKKNTPDDQPPPRGGHQVKEAILAAAERLLLKHGPSEISVRAIAAAANVKHPLIYRHFGSKNALILAVHERQLEVAKSVAEPITRLEGNIGKLFDTFAHNRWRQITLARAMIEGIDPKLLQNQFPVMQRLVELLRERSKGGSNRNHDPESLAMAMGGLAMGWILFAPFLKASTGTEHLTDEEINRKAVEILEEFVEKIC
ncbi:MAG TPA: TetR/AcrR family transcriptional regulator [Pyrinomonadaceae bacterium]|nr:TetR/AcrR family transcriptional regulator [Pyrinomonadaceae bacterium]